MFVVYWDKGEYALEMEKDKCAREERIKAEQRLIAYIRRLRNNS